MIRGCVAALLLYVSAPGLAQTPAAPAAAPPAGPLREVVEAARHPWLRWPDFSDYRAHVSGFYEAVGWRTGWTQAFARFLSAGAQTDAAQMDGDLKAAAATLADTVDMIDPGPVQDQAKALVAELAGFAAPARAVVALLEKADEKGLFATDYDGSRWSVWATSIGESAAHRELFDAALTASVMRYISDLRIGRIPPRHVRFELEIEPKKLHLPTFVAALQRSSDPKGALDGVEPPYPAYRLLRAEVARYRALAQEPFAPIAAPKGLEPGATSPAADP